MHDRRMSTAPSPEAAGGPDTLARLLAVLREIAPQAKATLRPEDRLIEDVGLDSMALARAVVALEDAFGIELPPERLHELRSATIGDLAALLASSVPA